MASPKEAQLLEDFEQCFAGLMSLFKTSRSLPVEDQLFIENRLLLLHMEYHLWSARLRRATRFPTADDQIADTQPSSTPAGLRNSDPH
jgi:hypothetical protein